jgi:hypothetical protein
MYRFNPNYTTIVKQDTNKLFIVGFIKPSEELTWLSPLIVVVPKKNGKLKTCINFKKFNMQGQKKIHTHYLSSMRLLTL